MRIFRLGVAMVLAVLVSVSAHAQGTNKYNLSFCCRQDNDLYRLFSSRSEGWNRYDKPKDAVRFCAPGSGLVILADGYPYDLAEVDPALFDEAVLKGLRVYVEFPRNVPGLYTIEQAVESHCERGVVSSRWFEPEVERMRILTINDCHYVPTDHAGPYIVLTRVAGYDTAVFGLPEWVSIRYPDAPMFPILMNDPLGDVLVSSTKLSQFVTARYGPTDAWRSIWQRIIRWASRSQLEMPSWIPTVHPMYGMKDVLPDDAHEQAWRRGAQWYLKAKMMIDPSWATAVKEVEKQKDRLALGAEQSWVCGDGKLGMLEGFSSKITFEGRQLVRFWQRADCTNESAMALAFDGVMRNDTKNQEIAANLLDFVYFNSDLNKGPRSDPGNPAYGLLGWSTGPNVGSYFGDDNARAMLATMAASSLLKTNRWDESLMRCLLANLRTTGAKGFRPESLDQAALDEKGWRAFYTGDTVVYAPHYESYLWACFLWAYKHTEHAEFLDKAKTAIKMTMEAYPDKWRWTNGMQQERARMLLPLAWLVRVEDNDEHRQWLKKMATDLLALQEPCGAIREELGPEGNGTIPPPKSNKEYGTAEAPIIQANGDPACDLLYTTDFAFLGLHEAAAATGDAFYAEAEKKLGDFLCRSQIRSLLRPEFDGGWFRGFDFKKWEYWGSGADDGWGPWTVETGWSQGWITSTFALRQRKTSLWDMTLENGVKKHMEKLMPVMFTPPPAPEPPKPAAAEPAKPAVETPPPPAPETPKPAVETPPPPAPEPPKPVVETPPPPAPEAPKAAVETPPAPEPPKPAVETPPPAPEPPKPVVETPPPPAPETPKPAVETPPPAPEPPKPVTPGN